MLNISDYQLFLFDFDGLLVNTEPLHFEAYQKMCQQRGYHFPLDFSTYLKIALFETGGIEEMIYQSCPELRKWGPWATLYEDKKSIYLDLVQARGVDLMPGVERFLGLLERKKIKSCLVTHSRLKEVESIRENLPILQTIPYVISRENYSQPKPNPECYQIAIEKYGVKGERAIGFEDSPRGLKALLGSEATAVLISSHLNQEEVKRSIDTSDSFAFFGSFSEFVEKSQG